MDLQALASSCDDAAQLIALLLRRRVPAHPSVDIPSLTLSTIKARADAEYLTLKPCGLMNGCHSGCFSAASASQSFWVSGSLVKAP